MCSQRQARDTHFFGIEGEKNVEAHECGRRPQAQRHLTFLPDAVTSHAKTPVPAEAQNLQGKEPTTVDLCRFKVSALKRPQSSFADWYSKERRQRESRAKACPRFALALSPPPASARHHIQNHNCPKLNRCAARNQSGNRKTAQGDVPCLWIRGPLTRLIA